MIIIVHLKGDTYYKEMLRKYLTKTGTRFLIFIVGLTLIIYLASSAMTGPQAFTGRSSNTGASKSNNVFENTNLGPGKIKTVFLIVMENHNWSDIQNNPSAPYINKTLLPESSYAKQFYNPFGNHPSEPNYLWLEAGTNFGILHDGTPQGDHQNTSDHLVTLLNKSNISWKAYLEGISGNTCPLSATGLYAPRHNPMVYFNDVTNNNDPNSTYCITHERPLSELKSDLQHNNTAQYNFISANLCHDMHNDSGCGSTDSIKNGDTWLSQVIPMIMDSPAYKQGGVIFITWDESAGNNPIGMIVLSPFAKGDGYSNTIHYTHSSTLRTLGEIFNVRPFLGDASKATDLRDLFSTFP